MCAVPTLSLLFSLHKHFFLKYSMSVSGNSLPIRTGTTMTRVTQMLLALHVNNNQDVCATL